MASAAGDIIVSLGLNRRGFATGLTSASKDTTGFVSSVTTSLARVGLAAQGLRTIFESVRAVVSRPIMEAAGMEQAEIGFTTLLGSTEAAMEMMKDLKAFAKSTPFEFTELRTASTRMMAMGFASQEVLPMMRTLGDATSALGGGSDLLQRMVVALGQMRAKGVVAAQEMNQLAEAGVPAWELLSKAIGVSIPEAMKMAEARMIDAGTAIPAFLDGMAKKFGGGMEAQSKTLGGMWSNLKDTIAFALADIGEALDEAFNFKDAIARLMILVDVFKGVVIPVIQTVVGFVRDWWRAILAVVIAMGTYRAALAAVLLVEKAIVATRAMALALSGPKGWVALAAGIAVAGGALRTLQVQYQEAAAAARDAATAAEEHTAGGGGGGKGVGVSDPTADPGKVLAGVKDAAARLEQLQFIRDAQPMLGEALAKPVLESLDGLMAFEQGLNASETAAYQLRAAMQVVANAASNLGQARADKLRESLVGEIGRVTGIADAIAKARTELDLLNGSTNKINVALGQFAEAGALPEQIEELRRLMEEAEQARGMREFGTEMAKVNSEIHALQNGLSAADMKLQEFAKAGLDDHLVSQLRDANIELQNIKDARAIQEGLMSPAQKYAKELERLEELQAAGLLSEEEVAAAAMQKHEQIMGKDQSTPLGSFAALERGSSGAASAIAKAMNNSDPQAMQKKQWEEQKRTNSLLSKIEKGGGTDVIVGSLA